MGILNHVAGFAVIRCNRTARWVKCQLSKAGKLAYVNPWKIPTFDLNRPLRFYMVTKEHVIFGFVRGAMLRDPGKLLEGTGKYLRHVKLQSAADVRRSEVRALLEQAAELKSCGYWARN